MSTKIRKILHTSSVCCKFKFAFELVIIQCTENQKMIPLHNAVSVNINMQTANNVNNKAKNSSKKFISVYALLRMDSLKLIRLFGEFRSGSRLQILIVKHLKKKPTFPFFTHKLLRCGTSKFEENSPAQQR